MKSKSLTSNTSFCTSSIPTFPDDMIERGSHLTSAEEDQRYCLWPL